MAKCPYNFSLRSRTDIIGFLTERKRAYFTWRTGYAPLTWNIKVYDYDSSGLNRGQPDYPITRRYDVAWQQWLQEIANCCTGETNEEQLFWRACEDGLRYYLEDYTVWPGDDVDAKFAVLGRSGGYLCLEKWNGHQLWHCGHGGAADFERFLQKLPFKELRELYKLVVCLDRDIQPEAEVSHQFHFYRADWEQENAESLAHPYPLNNLSGWYTRAANVGLQTVCTV